MVAAYTKYAVNNELKCELLTSETGHAILQVRGKDAGKAFKHETGQHVVQRVPPTENRGRKQTSVVRVAVLPMPPDSAQKPLPDGELETTTQCGHGPGGQHQNKTASAVRMKHIPTGLMVFINGRDQHSNRREALKILTARVNEHYAEKNNADYSSLRKERLGDGGRGSKIRTYNYMESRVVDHRYNIKTRNVREVIEKGHFEILFPKN